jgi:hypothetical protein
MGDQRMNLQWFAPRSVFEIAHGLVADAVGRRSKAPLVILRAVLVVALTFLALAATRLASAQVKETYLFDRIGLQYKDVSSLGYATVAGDFNGDGVLDLATVGFGSNDATAIVLLGKPDGTFNPPTSFNTGLWGATSMIVSDVNGDGKLDLVLAGSFGLNGGSGGAVSVLLGNGDGTFQTAVQYAQGMQSANSVIAADFNGDGKPDLAVSNPQADTILILINNGNGTFRTGATLATGSEPQGMAAADFNGDGKADLAVASLLSGSVGVYLGNGDGTFGAALDQSVSGASALAAADLNGDGKVDLAVVGSSGNGLSILLGNGDGTFEPPQSYGQTWNNSQIVLADVNRDGILDVVTPSFNGNYISVFLGVGNGTFRSSVNYFCDGFPFSLAVGDFNGDGVPDIAASNEYSGTSVSIMLGRGDGSFAKSNTYSVGLTPSAMAFGDFRRSGRLDLAVANEGSNSVSILLANGDGSFQSHVDYSTGNQPTAVAAGDLNGDGVPDLAVSAQADNSVSILIGNGDGTFGSFINYPVGTKPSAIALGDFNGDGFLDLAVTNSGTNSVSVLLGNGHGGFSPQVAYATGTNPQAVMVKDLNGDGHVDLVVANMADNSISVLLGNGDGTFRPHVDYATGTGPTSVASADFNGDGKPDLVVADFSDLNQGPLSGVVSVMLGNGDGTFQPHVDYNVAPRYYARSVVAADVNGDGRSDIVVASQGQLTFLLGNGDGSFQGPINFFPGPFGQTYSSLVVADFNGDGAPDVAITGDTLGGLAVLLSPPVASVFPRGLTFGPEPIGQTSALQALSLANPSPAPLSGLGISTNGDFGETQTCGSNLSPGASCTINVTFTPIQAGQRSGTLIINDNAPSSPQKVPLAGTGNGPFASALPSSLAFGSQDVGTTSTSQSVTLQNSGNSQLTIASIASSGDFAEANNCGAQLTAAGSCTIKVSFTPSQVGTRTGTLTVTDNSNGVSGSQQIVSLSGTGTTVSVGFQPTSLTFANQTLGTTSASQTITLSNSGTAALTINGISITGTNSGDFVETNSCGTSVAAAGSCTISVTFTPTSAGARSASVSVSDNASGSPQTVLLSGTATTVLAGFQPTGLTFSGQIVGTTSTSQSVTLSNSGTAALTISSISITGTNSGDFAQTNTCGNSVAAGGICAISVTFTPAAAGTRSASISVADDASGSPQTIPLSGIGTTASVGFQPTSLTFLGQIVTTTSAAQSITLGNSGTAALTVYGITITGTNPSDFDQTNTCGNSVVAGGSCTISVAFRPTAAGARSASISVLDNASGSPQTVPLSGTGTTVSVGFQPTSLTFPGQIVGTSTTQAITLSNSGSAGLVINGISITGTNSGDFAETNTCGSSVAAGGSCTISVTFTPMAGGTRLGFISVSDNATGSPQTVSLSGSGLSPDFTISASTLNPTSIAVGQSGTSTITITSVNGFNTIVSLTCSGLPMGASCSFNPNTLLPTSNGTATSTMTITTSSSTPTGNFNVMITGTTVSNGHSSTLALSVQGAPDFNLSAGNLSATSVSPGQSATSTITVSSVNGFANAVSLSCSVSPSPSLAPSCTLSTSSVTPAANGSSTSTLTITTTAATASNAIPPGNSSLLVYALSIPFPALWMFVASSRRRSRIIKWRGFVFGLILGAVAASISGCGGGGGSSGGGGGGNPGTPAESYTVTIAATSGSTITHSTTVSLTVQ